MFIFNIEDDLTIVILLLIEIISSTRKDQDGSYPL